MRILIYSTHQLLIAFEDAGIENDERLSGILNTCGYFLNEYFILVDNEAVGRRNPWINVVHKLEKLYPDIPVYDIFSEIELSEIRTEIKE